MLDIRILTPINWKYPRLMADIFQGHSLTFPTLNTLTVRTLDFRILRLDLKKFLRSMSEFPLLELRILKLNILSVPTLNILIVPKAWFQNSQAWSQNIRNLVLRIPTLELRISMLNYWKYPLPMADTFNRWSLTILVLDILTINMLDVRIFRLYLRRFPCPFTENTHARWLFSTVDLWHFPRSILWQFPRLISEFLGLISKFPTLELWIPTLNLRKFES